MFENIFYALLQGAVHCAAKLLFRWTVITEVRCSTATALPEDNVIHSL